EDYYETFITLFTSAWQRAISRSRHFEQRLMKKIDELKENESLTPENEAAMNELLEELYEWMEYYDWIRRVNRLFESGEIFKHVAIEPLGSNNDEYNTYFSMCSYRSR